MKQQLRNDGTPKQRPIPAPWYRLRMQRTLDTIHNQMAADLHRQMERHSAGRFCWNPLLRNALREMETTT